MSTRLDRIGFYPASYDLFLIDTLYRQGTLHVFRSTEWQSMLRISDSLIYPSRARKIKCLDMYATEYPCVTRSYSMHVCRIFRIYCTYAMSESKILSISAYFFKRFMFKHLYVDYGTSLWSLLYACTEYDRSR